MLALLMRLLVISNLYPPAAEGGYEMQCADTVAALTADGHEIQVLTTRPRRGASQFAAAAPVSDERVLRTLPYLEFTRLDSVRAPEYALQGASAMRAAIAAHRPNLLLFFNFNAIPHSALWVAQQSGIPVAFYVAAPMLDGIYVNDRFGRHLVGRDRGLRRGWSALMHAANLLPALRIRPNTPFSASAAWVSEATRLQTPAPPWMTLKQSRVINPATRRYERFASAERQPAPGEPLIAFAGRLEPEKGPDVAVRALAHLRGALGVSARLALAGPGTEKARTELQTLARELGIAEHVDLLGPLDLPGMIDLFRHAHLLVVPSVWQEPMATTCIEAAFARIPLVASRSGGMPEAMREDAEALYFPISDAAACARAFASTIGDAPRTAERVARARQRADDFSFERYMERMTNYIEAAV